MIAVSSDVTLSRSGFIEAGDILTTSREILVGKSVQADSIGVEEQRQIVTPLGHSAREVQTLCGSNLGGTKEPTSIIGTPASLSVAIQFILAAVGMITSVSHILN